MIVNILEKEKVLFKFLCALQVSERHIMGQFAAHLIVGMNLWKCITWGFYKCN